MQAREVRKPYALKGLSSSPLWNWLLLPCSLCHQQPRTAQKHIFQTENCCAPLAHRIISKCVVCNCYHLGDSSKLICPSAVSENSNLDFCFTDILLTRRRPFQGLELVSQSKVSYTLDPEPSENDRWPRMKKKKRKNPLDLAYYHAVLCSPLSCICQKSPGSFFQVYYISVQHFRYSFAKRHFSEYLLCQIAQHANCVYLSLCIQEHGFKQILLNQHHSQDHSELQTHLITLKPAPHSLRISINGKSEPLLFRPKPCYHSCFCVLSPMLSPHTWHQKSYWLCLLHISRAKSCSISAQSAQNHLPCNILQ